MNTFYGCTADSCMKTTYMLFKFHSYRTTAVYYMFQSIIKTKYKHSLIRSMLVKTQNPYCGKLSRNRKALVTVN